SCSSAAGPRRCWFLVLMMVPPYPPLPMIWGARVRCAVTSLCAAESPGAAPTPRPYSGPCRRLLHSPAPPLRAAPAESQRAQQRLRAFHHVLSLTHLLSRPIC